MKPPVILGKEHVVHVRLDPKQGAIVSVPSPGGMAYNTFRRDGDADNAAILARHAYAAGYKDGTRETRRSVKRGILCTDFRAG